MDFMTIITSGLSIGGLGILFGLGLGIASKKFAIEVDEKVVELRSVLPGANCGGCGYTGCDAFAKALAAGEAKPNGCPVGGDATTEAVSKILGVEAGSAEKTVAYIKCKGDCNVARDKYQYIGIQDCVSAAFLQGGGPKSCSYGCLGLGSCVKACMFDAIDIKDGIAVINEDKCVSCGMCVEACPKDLIEIIPIKKRVRVDCSSQDKAKDAKTNCDVACIGCRKCSKECPVGAISFNGPLAVFDYSICISCGKCEKVCPTHAITKRERLPRKPKAKPKAKIEPKVEEAKPEPAILVTKDDNIGLSE